MIAKPNADAATLREKFFMVPPLLPSIVGIRGEWAQL
jgi:hypothetical protein